MRAASTDIQSHTGSRMSTMPTVQPSHVQVPHHFVARRSRMSRVATARCLTPNHPVSSNQIYMARDYGDPWGEVQNGSAGCTAVSHLRSFAEAHLITEHAVLALQDMLHHPLE